MNKTLEAGLLDHADREAPRECCGLLVGRDGIAGAQFILPNISQHAERAYFADPRVLFDVLQSVRHTDRELLGIYHSHPQSSPAPSSADIEQAYYPDCAYVIIGSRECDVRIMAYRIAEELVSTLVVEWVEQ